MASIQYVVQATDAASTVFGKIAASADGLDKQLADLSKRVATPEVDLKDAKFQLGMIAAAKRLDKLSEMVASPGVEVDTAKAQTEILRVNAMLDRLNAKKVTATVDVKPGRSFLGRLRGIFPGGGGAADGAAAGGAQAGGGVLGSLFAAISGSGAAPYLWGGGIGLAALLAPALLPVGLGLGAGGLGALGGVAVGAKDRAKLLALQKQLAGVTGTTASSRARRGVLQGQITAYQQAHGPQLAFGQAGAGLLSTAQSTFFGALTARGPGQGAPSFLTGLSRILEQVQGFIKSIGPGLGDLFRASIPYLKSFVGFMEQAAKTLLPVFTQMLKQMAPFLPVFAKGLMDIVGGLAGFLKAIGPSGMEASAKIFVFVAKLMAGVLVGLGHTINWLTENTTTWVHDVAAAWDWMFRHVSKLFDEWRHGWAHDWDSLFNDTIGMVIRNLDRIVKDFNNWSHTTAKTFDSMRHNIAAIWDQTWNNTVSTVRNGIGNVMNWIGRLPGDIRHVFSGAINWLNRAGRDVIQGLWNGLESIWHKVQSFVSGIANWIKNNKGPVSLDAKLLEPAGRALMSGLLRGLTGGFGDIASFIGGAAGRIARGLGFGGGGPTALQQAAGKLMSAFGWDARSQLPALIALWNQESGWRWNATNPTSGAYGIPQALPASKMASAGADWRTNPMTQILWGMSYIKSVYGSPAGAEAHELAAGWYGRGLVGGIFNRPTLIGVGERGPERVDVTPVGQGRSHSRPLVHVENQYIQNETDIALTAARLSFLITASSFGS